MKNKPDSLQDTIRFRRSPDRWATEILDHLPLVILVVDRQGIIQYRNAAAQAWISPNVQNIEDVFRSARHVASIRHWSETLRAVIEKGESHSWAATIPSGPTESTVLVTIRAAPMGDDGIEPVQVCVLTLERVDRPTMPDTGTEFSKHLTSLGFRAAQIAHELNNPLDGILRYINLALRLVGEAGESKLRSYLSESRAGLLRMIQIIGDLLEISRSHESDWEQRSVNEIVEEALRAAAVRAEEQRVIVAADFQSADMPAAQGSRLYQVCINLIKNALDAMPKGGRLCVTTGRVGDEVIFRVADTGVGLPLEAGRIFEPFFTTKPAGQGTGLGLAICKDLVEDMGGRLAAANGPDGGAVFTVRIPVDRITRRG